MTLLRYGLNATNTRLEWWKNIKPRTSLNAINARESRKQSHNLANILRVTSNTFNFLNIKLVKLGNYAGVQIFTDDKPICDNWMIVTQQADGQTGRQLIKKCEGLYNSFTARCLVTHRTTETLLSYLRQDFNAVVINHLGKYMQFTLQCCTCVFKWLWKCKCGLKERVRFKGKVSLDGWLSRIHNVGSVAAPSSNGCDASVEILLVLCLDTHRNSMWFILCQSERRTEL